MIFQLNNIVYMYAGTAAALALVGLYYWRRRNTNGALYLSLLMFAAMIWAAAEVLEMGAVDPSLKVVFGKLSYVGVVSVAPLWLLFNLAYGRRRNRVQRKDVLLLWIVPAIILALVFTNDWHHLIWTSITPSGPEPGAVLIYGYGVFSFVNIVYVYSIMLAATLILFRTSLRTFQHYVPQTLALIFGGLVPLAGNFIYFVILGGNAGIDPTPVSIAILGLFFAGCTVYLKLFDLVPVARERLISDMIDGILVVDSRGRIVDMNDTAVAFLGNSPVIGSPLETALAGLPDLMECCRMAEWAREVPAGSRWLEVRISSILDYGEATGRLIVLRDVTVRKQMEDELRRREEESRMILNSILVGVVTLDPATHKILDVNDKALAMIGASKEEVVGAVCHNYFCPVQKGKCPVTDLGQVVDTSERAILAKDGRRIPVLKSVVRGVIGGREVLLESFIDISERKKAEMALHASEDKFRVYTETSAVAIFVHDGTRLAYVNQFCETLTGYTRAELMELDVMGIVHPDQREMAREYARARMNGEDVPARYEIKFLTRSGDTRWCYVTAGRIEEGGRPAVILTAIDITDRKVIERQLEEEREELKRSNEELEQFAFIASHDLQEPLRMVNSYVKLLDRKYRGRLDDKADQYIAFIADGTERMQQMIKDLLKYSRVSSKGPDLSPVDLRAVMAETVTDLGTAIRESGAEIRCDGLPAVLGDQGQLRHVLENLVGNAIKFRMAGRTPVITVTAARKGSMWEIAVCDNGIGIDPQYFRKLFVIFQRLHAREEYAGNGIGLALCKKIVERHGGTIRVESAPGEGSTFAFTLPAVD